MSKRLYPSGAAKRKVTLDKKAKVESLPKLTSFFSELKADTDEKGGCEETIAVVATDDECDLPSSSLADALSTSSDVVNIADTRDPVQGECDPHEAEGSLGGTQPQ